MEWNGMEWKSEMLSLSAFQEWNGGIEWNGMEV